jgi:hypothetical protein
LHYLWDFFGRPSVLVALTDRSDNLTIDWEKFLTDQKAISFSKEPYYTFVTVLNRIWLFDDPTDSGSIEQSKDVIELDPHEFNWQRTNFIDTPDKTVLQINSEGKFMFTLKAFSSKDHGEVYPHLLHTANATQMDYVFKNISTPYKNPRLGMEFVLVASEKRNGNFTVNMRKSLDDEHTPGIFEVVEIMSPISEAIGRGGYLQYRKVSYTHPERDVSSSTTTKEGVPITVTNHRTDLIGSLAYSFFGDGVISDLVQKLNITIGEKGDEFYSKTNYTTFTLLAGYGKVPTDVLSAFVIVIAAVGLGLPILLIIFGACYVCVKRQRNRSS